MKTEYPVTPTVLSCPNAWKTSENKASEELCSSLVGAMGDVFAFEHFSGLFEDPVNNNNTELTAETSLLSEGLSRPQTLAHPPAQTKAQKTSEFAHLESETKTGMISEAPGNTAPQTDRPDSPPLSPHTPLPPRSCGGRRPGAGSRQDI